MTGCVALFIKKYIIYISNRKRIQKIHINLANCGLQDEENNNGVIFSPSSNTFLNSFLKISRHYKLYTENYAVPLIEYYEIAILFSLALFVIGKDSFTIVITLLK